MDTSGTSVKGLFALGALYHDLEVALEKEIDVITVQSLQQEAQMPSDERFRDHVWKEKVNLYAVAFCILQIGELSGGLSAEYRAATANSMLWTAIKGMRNFVAHNYGNISREIIWETVTHDIPLLRDFCQKELEAIE